MESIVTCLAAGSTRTRIIDWVSTWSGSNFWSSSDPSSRTVKGASAAGVGVAATMVADATGMSDFCPVVRMAVVNAGKKYANAPNDPEMTNPRITSTMVVMGSSATNRWPRRDPSRIWLVDARGRYRKCGTVTWRDAQSTGRVGL